MSAVAMFPHVVGCVDTRDLYTRATLDRPIAGAEVLALLDDLDAAHERVDEVQKELDDAEKDYCKQIEDLNAEIASLNDTIVKRNDEIDDLTDKLEACKSITPEEAEALKAERDAIAMAAQTWTTSKLTSFILETAERQRLENVAHVAELQRLRAGVQRLTRGQRAKVGL